MFDFRPTEEQQALKTMVREFVEREVKPKAPAYDAEPDPIKGIPWDIIEAGHKLGLKNLAVPKGLKVEPAGTLKEALEKSGLDK